MLWRNETKGRWLVQVGNDRYTSQSDAVRIDTECEPLCMGLEERKTVKDPPSFLVHLDEAFTNQIGIYRHI